jgi:hypothetical protein
MEPFQELFESEMLAECFRVEKSSWYEVSIKTLPDSTMTPIHYTLTCHPDDHLFDVFDEVARGYVAWNLIKEQMHKLIIEAMES